MSRASWYRHGKPSEKPKPKGTQRQMAELAGVSVRTIQRDQAAVHRQMLEEVLKAKAEGRKLDAAAIQEMWWSLYADKCQQRETAAMTAVEAALGRLERIAAAKEQMRTKTVKLHRGQVSKPLASLEKKRT